MDKPDSLELHHHGSIEKLVQVVGPVGAIVQGSAEQRSYTRFIPSQPPHPLFGRTSLLEDFEKRLLARDCSPLLMLTGAPGLGKTSLALALAHRANVQEQFPIILWASLGRNGEPAAALRKWAEQLHCPIKPDDPISRVRAYIECEISRRATLLIVDDVCIWEHWSILSFATPRTAQIITTERKDLPTTIDAHDDVIPALEPYAALQLLAYFADSIVRQEPRKISAIAKKADGVPLALILIGQQLRLLSRIGSESSITKKLETLNRAFDQAKTTLVSSNEKLPAPALERSQSTCYPAGYSSTMLTLETAVAMSVGSLSDRLRQSLFCISHLPPKPNTFSEEAFVRITGDDVLAMEELAARSLIEKSEPGRFEFYGIIGRYAQTLGRDLPSEQQEGAKLRMCDYFVELACSSRNDLRTLSAEYENIVASVKNIASETSTNWFGRFLQLQPFLERHGLFSQDSVWSLLEQAQMAIKYRMGSAGPIADFEIAGVLLMRATAAEKRGNYPAMRSALESLNDSRIIKDTQQKVMVLQLTVRLNVDVGDYRRAEDGLAKAIGMHLSAANTPGAGDTGVDTLLRALEDLDSSAITSSMVVFYCSILSQMAEIQLNSGNLELADRCISYATKLTASSIDSEMNSRVFLINGVIAFIRQDFDAAERHLRAGLHWAERDGLQEQITALLHMRAAAAHNRGQLEETSRYLKRGLQLAKRIKHPWYQSAIYNEWGELHRKRRRFKAAAASLEKAIAISRNIGAKDREAFALFSWARVERDRGDYEAALQRSNESLELFNQMRHYMESNLRSFVAEILCLRELKNAKTRLGDGERLEGIPRPRFSVSFDPGSSKQSDG